MRKISKLKKQDIIAGYSFIGLWIIGFFLFLIFPLIMSFYFSFTKYDVLSSPKFIGLGNFQRMLKDRRYWNALKATFKNVIFGVPIRLVSAFIFALIFNLREHRILNLYRAIYYIPSLVGGSIAIAVLWRQIFGLEGIINTFLKAFGITGPNWLGDTRTAIWTLILLGVWQFGSSMLIFLAGLKQIPQELYESASIDGAGFWRQLISITLPMLSPVILFNLIMQTIGSFTAFTQAFVITGGGPLDSTLFYALYVYQQGFQNYNMGYACAMAWILLLIVAFFTFLIFKTSASWVYYEAERR